MECARYAGAPGWRLCSGASYKELIHQLSGKRRPGQLPEDAINAIQLRDRAGKSPAELITELRRVGPVQLKIGLLDSDRLN